ncbi:MAG: tyrB [Firmicutes bacterium]|nr:tyrB [Bacillota bacterium]
MERCQSNGIYSLKFINIIFRGRGGTIMAIHVTGSHMHDKVINDKIFKAGAAAKVACERFGTENVVDASIGVLLDDNEKLVSLSTVEKVFRNLPMSEITNYAPIAGLPDYLENVLDVVFRDCRPDAYAKALATAGGTGAIHHAVWNYTDIGDSILTSDWYWGPYQIVAEAFLRKLETFTMFDENRRFNTEAFRVKVEELQAKQTNTFIILNTPAHNPMGYSLDDDEWDGVIEVIKNAAKNKEKNIILLVDIAYIAYCGDQHDCRTFMKKFSGLPENVMVIIAYSMSKGYTLYGQRAGAIVGISSSRAAIEEFDSVNNYLCRATWSNINRSAMDILNIIHDDKGLTEQIETERDGYYQMLRRRSDVFLAEAKAINMPVMPYVSGFFMSVPAKDPEFACEKLFEDNVFTVPMMGGLRIAICGVPFQKLKIMAERMVKVVHLTR